jgi:thioredoxin reductase
MQRRNFISNLAVILPAGIVAPKLLLEDSPVTGKLVKTKVLILGAGDAGLFIARKFKEQKIETVVLEPGSGAGNEAIYNHHAQPGIIRQYNQHQKAETVTISSAHHEAISEEVNAGFVPTSIRKTGEGYFVTDGTTTYQATKLVVALPLELDTTSANLKVNLNTEGKAVHISCKRKNMRNPATLRTISAAKIDEAVVAQFGQQQAHGLLAVL